MRLRTARKIAARLHHVKGRSYNEWQLFRAYMRLHRAWRAYRVVTVERRYNFGDVEWQAVTPDFFLASRVSTFISCFGDNEQLAQWVRLTWHPPQS